MHYVLRVDFLSSLKFAMLFTTSTSPKHRSPTASKSQVVERLNLSKLVDEDDPTPLSDAEITQCISKLLSLGDQDLVRKFFQKRIRPSQLSQKQLVLTLQCFQSVQLYEEAVRFYEEAQKSSSRSGNLGEVALLEYMKAAMSLNCNVDVTQVLDSYQSSLLDSVNYPQLAVNSKAVYYAFKLCNCLGAEGVERALTIRQLLLERELFLHYSNMALLITLSASHDRYDVCQSLYSEYQSLQSSRGFSNSIEIQMLAASQRFLDQDNCLIILQSLISRTSQGQLMDQRALAVMLSACVYLTMWGSGCSLMEENLNRFPHIKPYLLAELSRFITEYENLHTSPVAISSVETVLAIESSEGKLGSPPTPRGVRLGTRIEQIKVILQERQLSAESV
jgi:hypothetical protein